MSNNPHEWKRGDKFTMVVYDNRWHMRLWYFITFRKPPEILQTFIVTHSSNEVIINTLEY